MAFGKRSFPSVFHHLVGGDHRLPQGQAGPYLQWQPLISFDAFGTDRFDPPEGVMALSPIYVGADWKIS
ncbi:MAG: hypothetical protein ACLQPH_03220 [Acidimicrobiales bacterium]